MSGGFVKIYSSMLDSSVWHESYATRLVWITMLAMADRHGRVEVASIGLSRRANVTGGECDAALAILMAPDANSMSPEHDGRRVKKVDRGYQILNYKKYRELRSSDPDVVTGATTDNGFVYYVRCGGEVKIGLSKNPWARVGELRTARPAAVLAAIERGGRERETERHNQFAAHALDREWFQWCPEIEALVSSLGNPGDVPARRVRRDAPAQELRSAKRSYRSATSAPEAEANAVTDTTTPPKAVSAKRPEYDQIFVEAWAAYPKRPNNSKPGAYRQWLLRVGEGVDALDMLEGARRYARFVEAEGTEPRFVKHAETFFGRDRHFENDFTPSVRRDPLTERVKQQLEEDAAAEQRTAQLLAERKAS